MSLESQIRDLARSIGYADCRFTAADPFEDYRRAIEDRQRRFPEAAGLYAAMLGRADPRGSAPWARSVIVAVRDYGKYRLPPGLVGHIGRNYLADRRIAACPDAAGPKRMKEGLMALGIRVKMGGVPCRAAAVRCGFVRIGRNGFAYTREHGSWINIEAWRVDAELTPDVPDTEPLCPPGCRACQAACPTEAIVEPYVMRMDRCVAYLTYGAPEPVDADLRAKLGGWIYGCDACQEACPLNAGKWRDEARAPWLEAAAERLTPEALATMDEATYRDVVHPLFWYLPETAEGLARWQANARRACQGGIPARGPRPAAGDDG
jgi:epoxyqueuosine reductase